MTGCGHSSEDGIYVVDEPEDVERRRELEARLQSSAPVVTPEMTAEVAQSVMVKGTEALSGL